MMNGTEHDLSAPLLTIQDLQNSLVERTLSERHLDFDDDVVGTGLEFVDFDLDSTSNEKLLEDIDLHLQQNILHSEVSSSTKVSEYIYELEAPPIDDQNRQNKVYQNSGHELTNLTPILANNNSLQQITHYAQTSHQQSLTLQNPGIIQN